MFRKNEFITNPRNAENAADIGDSTESRSILIAIPLWFSVDSGEGYTAPVNGTSPLASIRRIGQDQLGAEVWTTDQPGGADH